MRPETVAVIVSTYNRPDALHAVLRSLAAQTSRDFEIVIADDGSSGVTREQIETFGATSSVPVRHVWQEDEGFRAAAIRNQAAAATEAEYLMFIDGDCVVRPDFVEIHTRLAEPGFFVRGSRILLDEGLTLEVLTGGENPHAWTRRRWIREFRNGRIDRVSPLFRLPLGGLRKLRTRKWEGVKTCNMAIWRNDLIAVNGFDEDFVGWGHEDKEVAVRLIHAGTMRKEGRLAAPVFHLWHARQAEAPGNAAILERRIRSGDTRAQRGIDRYL